MSLIEILGINIKDLLNPQFYIDHGGLWMILFIVFAETGLFAGFFLPGDALLFVTGIYSEQVVEAALFNSHSQWANLGILWVLIIHSRYSRKLYWLLVWRKKRSFFV